MDLITDPEDLLDMGALKGLCKVNDTDEGPRFSYTKSIEQIKIFKSENLPHLTVGNINGVTNIHYDVDCSLANNEKITDIIKILSEIDNNN